MDNTVGLQGKWAAELEGVSGLEDLRTQVRVSPQVRGEAVLDGEYVISVHALSNSDKAFLTEAFNN